MAQPRPASPGQPVTLIARVEDLRLGGGVPSGSVTFLDGGVDLGTVTLRRGKASLETSNLQPGLNTIQVDYTPGRGFAYSTAVIVENVRARGGDRAPDGTRR
jgi:large repetitive protein